MTFILQRVGYDREKGIKEVLFVYFSGLQKIHSPFNFPKEIFLDRFLYENKKALKNNHDEKKSLKIKERNIDNKINQLKDFKESNMSAMKILELANGFFEEQIEDLEKDFIEVHSDSSDEKIDDVCDMKELKRMSEIISKYKQKVEVKLKNLESRKAYYKVFLILEFANI